jgi:hypothetical protein
MHIVGGCVDTFKSDALYSCITCQATDGLGITNSDLDQLLPGWVGTSRDGYKEVDRILRGFILLKENAALTPQIVKKLDELMHSPVIQRHFKSSYKRTNPYNISRKIIEQ